MFKTFEQFFEALYILSLVCCQRSIVRGVALAMPIVPWPLAFLATSFCPAFGFNMPFFLAIKALDVRFVFMLLSLSSKGLVIGFLIGLFANHALIIVIADELDDSGRVDRPASLIHVSSNSTNMHVIKGRKGSNKNISILLIRHALAHRCKLLTKISQFHKIGIYIVVIPTVCILQFL